MKRRRSIRIDRSLYREQTTANTNKDTSSSANTSACSLFGPNLKRKKRNFASLKTIRQNLAYAIENEMVAKVKEILDKFEVCKSKKRKLGHQCLLKTDTPLVSAQQAWVMQKIKLINLISISITY